VERHGLKLRFKIPPQSDPLGRLFMRIEAAKARLRIREYSFSQTTLEQVFNFFAAQQEEEKGVARGMEMAGAGAGGGSGGGGGAAAAAVAGSSAVTVVPEGAALGRASEARSQSVPSPGMPVVVVVASARGEA
jgi:hypothetical protein